MTRNKFGTFILLGAVVGAAVSMLDRQTREQVTKNVQEVLSEISFYSKNPEILKSKMIEKKEKIESIVEKFSDDASYIKEKVDELKILSPQVKDLVIETKDAFTDAKDEYKSIVNENPSSD